MAWGSPPTDVKDLRPFASNWFICDAAPRTILEGKICSATRLYNAFR
jgi:hypothetical protein